MLFLVDVVELIENKTRARTPEVEPLRTKLSS